MTKNNTKPKSAKKTDEKKTLSKSQERRIAVSKKAEKVPEIIDNDPLNLNINDTDLDLDQDNGDEETQFMTTEMITPAMRDAGIDETTPLLTREQMIDLVGLEEVERIEATAADELDADAALKELNDKNGKADEKDNKKDEDSEDQYTVEINVNDKITILSGNSIVDIIAEFKPGKVSTKTIVTITKGNKTLERVYNVFQAKRLFSHPINSIVLEKFAQTKLN